MLLLVMDVVFPKNNEEAFLIKAKELNKDIIFIYNKKNKIKVKNYGFLSNKKLKTFSVYKATGDDRKAFEGGVNLIYHLEFGKRNDFIYSRNSGMNQVLAKIAKEKNVTIGFSMSDFSKNQELILGRMQQNMKLCKKYKVKTLVGSFANSPRELFDEITLKAFERLLLKKKLY